MFPYIQISFNDSRFYAVNRGRENSTPPWIPGLINICNPSYCFLYFFLPSSKEYQTTFINQVEPAAGMDPLTLKGRISALKLNSKYQTASVDKVGLKKSSCVSSVLVDPQYKKSIGHMGIEGKKIIVSMLNSQCYLFIPKTLKSQRLFKNENIRVDLFITVAYRKKTAALPNNWDNYRTALIQGHKVAYTQKIIYD